MLVQDNQCGAVMRKSKTAIKLSNINNLDINNCYNRKLHRIIKKIINNNEKKYFNTESGCTYKSREKSPIDGKYIVATTAQSARAIEYPTASLQRSIIPAMNVLI